MSKIFKEFKVLIETNGVKNNLRFGFIITVLNIVFSLVLQDVWVFIIRQMMLSFLLLILFLLNEEIEQFKKEDNYINQQLLRKYPLLQAERVLFLPAILCFFIFCNFWIYISSEFQNLVFFCLMIVIIYVSLCFYKVFCIVITPEIRAFYKPNLTLSEMTSLFKRGQIRKVTSAVAVKAAHVCKMCGKVAVVTGLGVWIGPKVVAGDMLYRGEILNDLTYLFNGYKARSEWDATRFNYFLNRIPVEKSQFLDSNRYIKPLELDKKYVEKNITLGVVEHKLPLSILSGWWSKKS